MPALALILIWLAALAVLFAWPSLTGSPTVGDDLTRHTVRVALAYYAAAAWLMLGLRPADWRADTSRGRFARWCWTLAWAAFVVHVGVAFHFYHHWSHAEAVAHVRERSGVGEGVFASYLFTLAWTADVAWWWLSPKSYAGRPGWADRALHGFMIFMTFAATVVYEEGTIRWAGAVLCVALLLRWAACAKRKPVSA
ncbi:MAG TPA: hypothetical protein VGF55_02355 [Gemmataceae bacterium]|jgi:hypothetical protein